MPLRYLQSLQRKIPPKENNQEIYSKETFQAKRKKTIVQWKLKILIECDQDSQYNNDNL